MHFLQRVVKNLTKYSDRPLFKQYAASETGPSWMTISYQTYHDHLNKVAAHWQHKLGELGVQPKNIVGIWLLGTSYTDLVHIYALIRAGYVPQIFHTGMLAQGSPLISDLLHLCNAKALVYDPFFSEHLHAITVPKCVLPELASLPSSVPGELPQADDDDIAMIFHTSGTTSGRPKPIKQMHRWMHCQAEVNWPGAWHAKDTEGRQKCFNNLGSFGHVATGTALNYLTPDGQCIIQTSKPDFEADELLAMVRTQGLNNLLLFPFWLSKLLAVSRSNTDVLDALRNMYQISFTGAGLNPEDAQWVIEQKLPVTSIYGTTETAVCLVSDIGDENVSSLRLIPGMDCQFVPLNTSDVSENIEGRDIVKLFDLFVPASAGNCPHPSIRNRPDGHVTGDLFEEIKEGHYLFRGRNDDWIKVGVKGQYGCDTKFIEDGVKQTCPDLVHDCVAVGSAKPCLVLFVEPKPSSTPLDDKEFKTQLLHRLEGFNAKLFAHEKIETPDKLVLTPLGSLPRTADKGNIKRREVEKIYADVLEKIYEGLEK